MSSNGLKVAQHAFKLLVEGKYFDRVMNKVIKIAISIPKIVSKHGFMLKKYHVFAPMGRFQLELIYLYFPPSSHLVYI